MATNEKEVVGIDTPTQLLDKWAERNYVRFVNRSAGQYSTDCVSRSSLLELINDARNGEQNECRSS